VVITVDCPPSMTATTLLVVPRSIPMIFPMMTTPLFVLIYFYYFHGADNVSEILGHYGGVFEVERRKHPLSSSMGIFLIKVFVSRKG
jgi:hypothetical protein